MSVHRKQQGSFIIELIVVVTVVVILASVAIPSMQQFLLRRDMDTSRATLLQSLQYAKQMARSQNTLVDVKLANNKITIRPRNSDQLVSQNFPQRVSLVGVDNAEAIEFVFRPVGSLARDDGDVVIDADVDLTILIQPSQDSGSDLQDSVVVGSYGSLASR